MTDDVEIVETDLDSQIETDEDAEAAHKFAHWLFHQECTFIAGSTHEGALPAPGLTEIAFAGRSNVGKSSLVNALTDRKTLARTSHTPGRTQQLNFFNLGDRVMLVDLPGYGYAQVSKKKVSSWTGLIFNYLRGRVNLKRVYVLIDSRHGFKSTDLEMMTELDKAAVSYQIVLTKIDKTTGAGLAEIQEAIVKTIKKHPACHPSILTTSSHKAQGIEDLRLAICEFVEDKRCQK